MTDDRDREPQVVDEPAARRYEARIGDRVVGFSEYRLVRGRMILFHTEVDPAHEGRGIGGRLAAGALDDALGRGLRITVDCPFIGAYLRRHPETARRLSMQTGPPRPKPPDPGV